MTIEPGVLITPRVVFGSPYVNEANTGVFTAGELLPVYNIVFGTSCISVGAVGVNLPGLLLSQYQFYFGTALVGAGSINKTFFPGALVQVSARPGLVTDTGLLLVLGFYVNFSATPLLGFKYQTINFTDETYGSFIASWYWEFGDGQTSTLQNPNHSYINTGYYSVRLRVTSTNGDISEVYKVNYIRIVALPGSSIGGNKELFGFKLESSPYTPETLASLDYRYPVYNIKVAPDIEVHRPESTFGNYGSARSISGKRSCGVNFSVDVYGMPSPATPPSYFEILRACGWKQTVHGTTGVSIKPDSSLNRVPATIEVVYEDDSDEPSQMVYKISGAMGSIKFIGEVGDPLRMEFTFIGALEYIRTRVYDDRVIPSNFDAAVPLPLMGASHNIVMGYESQMESFEITSNEVVNLFTNIFRSHGYDGARIVDRLLSGKMKLGGLYI